MRQLFVDIFKIQSLQIEIHRRFSQYSAFFSMFYYNFKSEVK